MEASGERTCAAASPASTAGAAGGGIALAEGAVTSLGRVLARLLLTYQALVAGVAYSAGRRRCGV
jgi:hypothetical protein